MTSFLLIGGSRLLFGGTPAGGQAQTAKPVPGDVTARPNIIIFHSHDYGQFVHCYGVKTVHTPHFDKLAEEGVRFAQSFCTAPGCSPSRASLFTGRYPHNNGVMGLTHANFAWDLYPGEKHLAQFLKEAGYATVAIGAIHETHSGAARLGYQKYINKSKATPGTTAGLAELRRLAAAGQPFYLYAGFGDTHRQRYPSGSGPMSGLVGFPGPNLQPDDSLGVEVPPYLRDTPGTRAELAGLQGAMRHLDEELGRWMDAVHELGLESNTLMIVTTDHGIAMPRAKCSVYDPGIQVALLLRCAGRPGWYGGIVRRELVSNIDVLPTILELVGIPIPVNVQGRSFAPLLAGRPYTPNREIFCELTYHDYYDPVRCIRTETHKLIANFSTAPSFMDPSQMWRPMSDPVVPTNPATAYHPYLELYDLTNDPWERVNLANNARYASLRNQLAARLYQHMVQTGDPLLQGAIACPQHTNTLNMLREAADSPTR